MTEEGTPQPFQWEADTSRLLEMALRNHDQEMMISVRERMTQRYDPELIQLKIFHTINKLIIEENWSFEDPETGEASPLI